MVFGCAICRCCLSLQFDGTQVFSAAAAEQQIKRSSKMHFHPCLQTAVKDRQKFFLYLAYHHPHHPQYAGAGTVVNVKVSKKFRGNFHNIRRWHVVLAPSPCFVEGMY